MFDIVYYYVPEKKRWIPPALGNLYNVNLTDWNEIIVTDSEKIYEHKSWFTRLNVTSFVDKQDECAEFLWNLKTKSEKLLIRGNGENLEANAETLITNKSELTTLLDEINIQRKTYYALYTDKFDVKKIVIYEGSETLKIFIRKEFCNELEKSISLLARKGSFSKYELGQEE